MHADIETMRVGELYAQHPLLRHLPVPRFRLPDVEVNVPVVIDRVDEPEGGDPLRGGPPLPALRRAFDKVLAKQLRTSRKRVSPRDREKIRAVLKDSVDTLEHPPETSVYTGHVADTMSRKVTNVLRKARAADSKVDDEQLQEFEDRLKVMSRIEFLKLRRKPPRLHALVTSSEVREAADSENVVVFRLKITEDSVEWTSIESPDGEQRARLVPE